MDNLVQNLGLGFSVALSLSNLAFCFIGVLLGTAVGVLPGIGPMATIAMLIPLTFSLPPEASIIMLAGIYYGAQYGSSTTAVLLNMPGEASSVVTAIDGHQMARQGRAGLALSTAALGSFFAGTVATFGVVIFAEPLTTLALTFGPAEYFSLILLGLIFSVALAHGSVLKAIAMILLGLLLGLSGIDIYTGEPRFTLGVVELESGLSFVALALGIFGIAEIMRNLEQGETREVVTTKVSGMLPGREDFRRIVAPILRGTALGSFLGVLPGGGPVLASFAAYAVEKKLSKRPEEFGHGAIEGVASPEAANNAGAQTSFIPMLTLGLPSNPLMALMIGALIMHGIIPGPNIVAQQPSLFWGLIASMWIGNLMLVILNLPLIGLWVKMLSISYRSLFPAIIVFATIGVYSVGSNPFELYLMAFFGVLGYLVYKLDCEPAPLMLGFILGPMLEEHLRRAMLLSMGDPMILIERPISAVLLAISAIVLVSIALPFIARKREEVFIESDS
jgi:TctA family transporter